MATSVRKRRPACNRATPLAILTSIAISAQGCSPEDADSKSEPADVESAVESPDREPEPLLPNRVPDASPLPTHVLSASGDAIRIRTAHGSEIAIRLSGLIRINGHRHTMAPVHWVEQNGSVFTTLDTEGITYELEFAPAARLPMIAVRLREVYGRDVVVRHEEIALTFETTDGTRVLGRDMQPVELDSVSGGSYLVDRWTPLEVSVKTHAGPLTVLRRSGFDSAVVERVGKQVIVHLEMDDSGNHPFRPYTKCTETYDPQLGHLDFDATFRRRGESVEHEAQIWLGKIHPIRPQRFPDGRRAAIVFTSHADQSTVPGTRALLFGHSRTGHPSFGTKGMIPSGLKMTLTAWATGSRGADMEDPEFLSILERASEAGFEICPHSATPKAERRGELDKLLDRYARFTPATWIDHQPETNCEAINNSAGLLDNLSSFYVLPELKRHGYRFLWSIPDAVPPGRINLLGPGKPAYRPTVLYPNPRLAISDWRPWMFKSIWRFLKTRYFLKLFNERSIARLIAERGIHIAHVYMDTFRTTGKLADRSLLCTDGSGGYQIREDVDALFRRLGRLQQSGDLWVTSMRDLGNHLIASADVRIEYRTDGGATIRAKENLKGWSVSIPLEGVEVSIDGEACKDVVTTESETVLWMDLIGGVERTLEVWRNGEQVRLVPYGGMKIKSR